MKKYILTAATILSLYSVHAMESNPTTDFLTSWIKNFSSVQASGTIGTKEFNLPPHTSLYVASKYLHVYLMPCDSDEKKNKLVLEGDKNYLPFWTIDSAVDSQTIALKMDKNCVISQNDHSILKATYYTNALKNFFIYETVKVKMDPQAWQNKQLQLGVVVACHSAQAKLINVINLDKQELELSATDNGRITCAGTSTARLQIATHEGSTINAKTIKAPIISVVTSKNSKCKVLAEQAELDAHALNNSIITYYGNPATCSVIKFENGQIKQKAISNS